MKKITLFVLLLFTIVGRTQVVNIPDASFKNYLLNFSPVIDTNGDGEIQVSEAQITSWLDITDGGNVNPIQDLTGLETFTNLTNLSIMCAHVTEIDLTALSQLTTANIDGVMLANLNLSGLAQLQTLSINASGVSIPDINLSGLTGVTSFSVNSGTVTLDLTSMVSLQGFIYDGSISVNVIFGVHPALTDVTIYAGYIPGQDFTSLDLSGCPNLQNLTLDEVYLDSLDVSACTNLNYLSFYSHNGFNALNLGNNSNLETLELFSFNLTELDASGCPNISALSLYLGDQFDGDDIYVNLKNGNSVISSNSLITSNFVDSENYTIYVCIDEGESFQSIASNVILNTYCSFTPGGDHNTISGIVTFDAANNGCGGTDTTIPFCRVEINDGTTTGYSYTSNGSYIFYTQAGNFTLTPQFENDWFTASPATVAFADNNNNTFTQNFCVTANGVHNDLEVSILPLVPAQPGFDAIYKIIYKNKGNQTLSGDITFAYNDDVLDYVSASPVETASTTGNLSWGYSNLLPFESREIIATLNVNSPMETPAVNIDDVLPFTAAITPVSGDETPDDNTFEYNQTVIGSYDPNDITCLEGATVSPEKIGEYLHYNINFENTGTAPATFVVVKDVIDIEKYDISTLQILDASHAMQARITGNKAEFIFDNINLAANGGKGNVAFKIKTLNSLAINSSVTQQADIYFDYNWPIVTNEATTTFAVLNTNNVNKDISVKLYPNPTWSTVNITAQSTIQTVQLYDVQGRLLQAANASGLAATIDVSGRAAGIYFIKVATNKGTAVEKLVKE